MAASLEKHLVTINEDNFVQCTNTATELRTRTALVAHLDKNALLFLPWNLEGQKETTIFYPVYRSSDYWNKGDMKTLITELQLDPNEGVLFGVDGTYTMQACLGVFPRNVETTITILKRWLNTQRRFLRTRTHIATLLDSYIDGKLSSMVKSHEED